jgi:hypothetical protein
VVVDGANVGHFGQNYSAGAFRFAQVDAVRAHFQALGLRVVIVLHEHWFARSADLSRNVRPRDGGGARPAKRPRTDAPAPVSAPVAVVGGAAGVEGAAAGPGPDAALAAPAAVPSAPAAAAPSSADAWTSDDYRREWRRLNCLCEVRRGNNDDWYWLYAAVASRDSTGGRERVFVVSNDQMRDHHFNMLAPRNFLKWRERHQVMYSFSFRLRRRLSSDSSLSSADGDGAPRRDPSSVAAVPSFQFPSPFSRRAQEAVDGRAWYAPVAENDGAWLVAHRPRDA